MLAQWLRILVLGQIMLGAGMGYLLFRTGFAAAWALPVLLWVCHF